MNVKRLLGLALALALGLATGPLCAAETETLDEDLALVRQALAVADKDVQAEPEPRPEPQPEVGAREPRWFRVRVHEEGHERATVSINLPIGLIRALGDDDDEADPLEWLSRLCPELSGLEASGDGRDLVRIEDGETRVRVWLE